MSDLLTLAQAAEGATAEEQGELLVGAWNALNPDCPLAWDGTAIAPWRVGFLRMLDAEAWESASLMLVPEEHSFDLSKDHHNQGGKWLCIVGPDEGYHQTGHANAATPALAIVAAALKAHASMETAYE